MDLNDLGILILVGGPLAIYEIWLFYHQYQAWRWGSASRSWPRTTGHVLTSEMRRRWSKGLPFDVRINYEYTVDGILYTGSRYKFGIPRGMNESTALDIVALYRPGGPVKVYFHPEYPQLAVLKPGVSTLEYIFGFIMCGLILVFCINLILEVLR